MFVPFDGRVFENLPYWDRSIRTIIVLFGFYVIVHLISFCYEKLVLVVKKDFFVAKLGNGKRLNIRFGDILADELTQERTNIVISFNRCFDTQVDDYLIRRNSLHGKLVNKLIDSGRYTEETLQRAIETSLTRPSNLTSSNEAKDKKIGKGKRYELGAVAEIEGVNNEHYFCLGLSEFNQNIAYISKGDYVVALNKLIERIIRLSQNYPVYIPLIGTGIPSLGISEELALMMIIHTILLHKANIYCDIYIVVRPELKYSIEKLMIYL